MTLKVLAAALALAALSAAAQTYSTPIRNTFATAAETVIDTASSLDLHADAATYDPQFQSLTTAKQALAAMVSDNNDDREQKAVSAINNMIFTLSACRIQAVDGTDITTCETQFSRARNRAMEAIHKHKFNGAWLEGPPV